MLFLIFTTAVKFKHLNNKKLSNHDTNTKLLNNSFRHRKHKLNFFLSLFGWNNVTYWLPLPRLAGCHIQTCKLFTLYSKHKHNTVSLHTSNKGHSNDTLHSKHKHNTKCPHTQTTKVTAVTHLSPPSCTSSKSSQVPRTSGVKLCTVVWMEPPQAFMVRFRSSSGTRPAQNMSLPNVRSRSITHVPAKCQLIQY